MTTADTIKAARELAADAELHTAISFASFGQDRQAPIVGRVGKVPLAKRTHAYRETPRDPVVMYRFPSRKNPELIRVLRSEAAAWVNLTPGVPPSRRLNATELRTADLGTTHALEVAAELLDDLAANEADHWRGTRGSASREAAARRGSKERRRQATTLRRQLNTAILRGPTAAEAAGAAEAIGHPPANAPGLDDR